MRPSYLTCLLMIGVLASDASPALAQRYPNKPIRIIVPFAAGGSVDALARVVGQQLSETFGQPIVVENRPGAGGNIGSDMTALVAGEVQVAIVPLAIARPLIESGQIRALAVTRAQRSPVLPDVPTIGETVPGFESTSWQGWFAPAKTPREIVDLVQGGVAKALQVPDVLERLRAWTNEPVGSRPEEFDGYFKAEVAKFKKVVKDANIPLQE
jgi:tripartite-type tricarboxylate transporter receptor subunit TctC